MVSVVINDYVVNKRVKLFFLPHDFELIQSKWEDTDATLERLQRIEFFKGRTRWCDLRPAHLRLMVAKNLLSASFLAEEDRVDDENPIVSSLNFLICTLVYCIEKTGDCHVESLKINRIGEMEVAVEYQAALEMEAPMKAPAPKPKKDPFTVVVDNTKDDE